MRFFSLLLDGGAHWRPELGAATALLAACLNTKRRDEKPDNSDV
jgi:hypothetical protein